MTDIIRKAAVFIRANAESAQGQRAAAALADMIDGNITAEEGLAALSECLGCELQIKSTVPNEATAFVVFSAREIRSAFDSGNAELAWNIADILQALPENMYLSDKKAVSAFNKTYIRKFNKKHIPRLPEIV
ncbi:hypothetical protein [Ruminococcus sp.]|uniref:hypothetical protein n=1 Tax=Ruminococcus sp. TaxID=41978 RepID=UPI002B832815|nr:hypothetical protein [Ruminococcus sp.]HNZ98730.1 hypothetical protein [Ruminococcus sp.]HOH88324.1 hypothetical protein [Ruminococcus sp.]